MKIVFFSFKKFEESFYNDLKEDRYNSYVFLSESLSRNTMALAKDADIIVAFVEDDVSKEVISYLARNNLKGICTRSNGYNHIDLKTAQENNIPIYRVPDYSPDSVAQHCLALYLACNRKICKADQRIKNQNFSLDGLIGRDISQLTIGVIGTGKIGSSFVRLMSGFGCKILGFDLNQNNSLLDILEYKELDELIRESDVISLHIPLTDKTYHLIDKEKISLMKNDVTLLNTSRGALINTKDLINGLKSGKFESVALDVYEEETEIFFHDLTHEAILDDQLIRLMSFPNVLITSHQGFLTKEALLEISEQTKNNILAISSKTPKLNLNKVTFS